ERFVPLVLEQLPQLPKANVIGEPAGRDTAAAVALAATLCRARFGNPTMIVLPADHMIEPVEAFEEAVATAVEAARAEEALYTFGVPPTYPATGYGYLEAGRRLTGETDRTAVERYQVLRFREKPSYSVAKEYVASGRYYWNSGMFVWTVDAIMREIERHLPEHARLLFPLGEEWGSPAWNRRLRSVFPKVPKISIDFGVMEKAERVSMVKAPFRWSDGGGWTAISAFLQRDAATNSERGHVYGLDARGNIVYCADEQEQVALVGVKDLVVVRVGGRTLVAHKGRVEDVKKVVESLQLQEAQGKGRWTADAPDSGTVVVV